MRIFTLLEERNYSAITFVNTINHEIETLECRKKEILSRIQHQVDHGVKAEKITKEILKDLAKQITTIQKQTSLKEARIQEESETLTKGKEHLVRCVRLIEQLPGNCQTINSVSGVSDVDGVCLSSLLERIEEFVFQKWKHESSDRLGSERRETQNAMKPLRINGKREKTKQSGLTQAQGGENLCNSRTSSCASLRPRDLPTTNKPESDSEDLELCERPLSSRELRRKTALSLLKRRRRVDSTSEAKGNISCFHRATVAGEPTVESRVQLNWLILRQLQFLCHQQKNEANPSSCRYLACSICCTLLLHIKLLLFLNSGLNVMQLCRETHRTLNRRVNA